MFEQYLYIFRYFVSLEQTDLSYLKFETNLTSSDVIKWMGGKVSYILTFETNIMTSSHNF